MKINEIRSELKSLNKEQLIERLDYTRQELFKLRLQILTTLVKDNSQFSKLRAQVSRILMCIQELQEKPNR